MREMNSYNRRCFEIKSIKVGIQCHVYLGIFQKLVQAFGKSVEGSILEKEKKTIQMKRKKKRLEPKVE